MSSVHPSVMPGLGVVCFAYFAFTQCLPANGGVCLVSHGGEAPGIAEISSDDERIISVRSLNAAPISAPFKIVGSASRSVVALACGGKKNPEIHLFSGDGKPLAATPVEGEVSDMAFAGETLIVAASRGRFHRISPKGEIVATFNARKLLDPPGRKGEHIKILPDGLRAIVSFQKDDDESPAKGNRLVVIDIETFKPVADIPLPRHRPELHIAADPTGQGPGPEVISLFPENNLLAVTLDLYGELLITDLDAALKGELRSPTFLPTSPDGAPGRAFPDRLLAFQHDGKPWLLISNASPDGGFALVDLLERRVARSFPAAAGAEMPVRDGDFIATVISGKTKIRTADGVVKESRPKPELHIFQLQPGEADAASISHRVHELPLDPVNIQPADRGLLFVTGTGSNGPEVLLVRSRDGSIADRAPLPGPPIRAFAWNMPEN